MFKKKLSQINHLTYYRFIKSVGATFNILMMIGANMVGYVIGLDGAKEILGEIFAPQRKYC